MELNKLLFPAPKSSYQAGFFQGEMIWIPRLSGDLPAIPCLFLSTDRGTNKILLYFHGNAEDIGMSYELLSHLSSALHINVIGIEYPGYGIYKGNCSELRILQDIENIYEYLTNCIRVEPKNIILFGRSIGTGPATWLASQRPVGALLLMSGYTNIRAVAKNIVGNVLMYFIKDRFQNIKWIKNVKIPVFIVHGQNDTLIPFEQSIILHKNCGGPCSLLLPESMNHNEFDFFDDLTFPFLRFLSRFGIISEPEFKEEYIKFPPRIFTPP
jgi:abhydrolase domain-containing protein 17